MSKLLLLKNKLKTTIDLQLIRYVFFAGTATVIDMVLLYILTNFFEIKYIISSALSYCVGMIINYSLNKIFNFKNKNKKIVTQFGIFVGVALVGLLLNQLIIFSLVELFKTWYMIAKIFSVSLVLIWSFWAHKNITFKTY